MSTYGRHKKLFFSWKDISAEQSRGWLLGCRPIETPKPIPSNRGSSDAIRGSKIFFPKETLSLHSRGSPGSDVALHPILAYFAYFAVVLFQSKIKNQKSKIHHALR
jgi:hypothetical protein